MALSVEQTQDGLLIFENLPLQVRLRVVRGHQLLGRCCIDVDLVARISYEVKGVLGEFLLHILLVVFTI